MSTSKPLKKVTIRPGVTILSVLRHLNYKPWFAMAEFVDNSLQSFLQNKRELLATDGRSYKLRVEIELSPNEGGRICVRDNAAGIHSRDYARAFRPAEVPPDRTGLAEFGMGMKSAACWFANCWSVRTSALGDPVEREIRFDINKIVNDNLEELSIQSRSAKSNHHFTEIVLDDLHRVPQGPTIGKIKEHLTSIYRAFLRDRSLELIFDKEPLSYTEPRILHTSHYKTPSGPAITWRKEIDIDLGRGRRVDGFAAIREKASTSHAGFALLRRRRLIQGSADEGYRPEAIFGRPNSYTYQRLFGELNLTGFEISHTKDGVRWNGDEEPMLELLRVQLDKQPMPLLRQAEEFRVRPKTGDLKPAAEAAAIKTAEAMEKSASRVLGKQLSTKPDTQPPPPKLPGAKQLVATKEISIEARGAKWQILLEQTNTPGVGDWLDISDRGYEKSGGEKVRRLVVRVSLAHPFMERFTGADQERIEPFLKLAAALALAETAARESGVRQAGTIRRNLNEFLRDVFSKP